jgi:cobalamin biosynthetic protein CobC
VTLPLHGGDLDSAERRWGRPEQGWLDLSTGINPWAYPVPEIPSRAWTRLPGRAEEQALLDAARAYWRVPDGAAILAAPGSQPLIQLIPRLFSPTSVAVVSPTYGEHPKAWEAAGHRVAPVATPQDGAGATVLVVVNPNNPDGRAWAPQDLPLSGELIVVDEAFGDTAPHLSLVPTLRPGMVVLKSFGKFHGLAGARLGFAIGAPDLISQLAERLGPWAVPGPSLAVGTQALADRSWADAMRPRLTEAAQRLDAVLAAHGLGVAGGTTLFRLVRHAHAAAVYERLGRAGILVRAFRYRPDWLRIGLPADAAQLARLDAAL